MKKIFVIVITVLMVFVLAACGTIESGTTGVKVVDGIVQDEPMSEGRYGNVGNRVKVITVNNKRHG